VREMNIGFNNKNLLKVQYNLFFKSVDFKRHGIFRPPYKRTTVAQSDNSNINYNGGNNI
jgi:hypothetical protein